MSHTAPLHETHEERLDRLHAFPAPPWLTRLELLPTERHVAAVREVLDRFNARHLDIIHNNRRATILASYHAKPE